MGKASAKFQERVECLFPSVLGLFHSCCMLSVDVYIILAIITSNFRIHPQKIRVVQIWAYTANSEASSTGQLYRLARVAYESVIPFRTRRRPLHGAILRSA